MTLSAIEHASVLLRTRAGLKAELASQARLERLLQESATHAGIPVNTYVDLVDTEPAAFDDLLDRVTVQHSAFFRDPAQFEALAEIVRKSSPEHHTVWSAGCGNGQEAYSIAMLLYESGRTNWHVVATDVSFRALARTEIGRYMEEEVQGLSPERQERYLVSRPGGYEIAPFLKKNVRMAHHNLARTYANAIVPEAEVVFCRNVLMYFGREESAACIHRIAERMAPGGHLFMGHSDSPGVMTDLFNPVRVSGVPCYQRLGAPPLAPSGGFAATSPASGEGSATSPASGETHIKSVAPSDGFAAASPASGEDLPHLLAEGNHAAAAGDIGAAVRAFRQATYLDPNQAIAYFQLGAALELAGDARESRRAFGAAGLAMMSLDGGADISGLGGYTRRDLARAIALKLSPAVA
jgi:chemotaxis protein methyltransferase CheR